MSRHCISDSLIARRGTTHRNLGAVALNNPLHFGIWQSAGKLRLQSTTRCRLSVVLLSHSLSELFPQRDTNGLVTVGMWLLIQLIWPVKSRYMAWPYDNHRHHERPRYQANRSCSPLPHSELRKLTIRSKTKLSRSNPSTGMFLSGKVFINLSPSLLSQHQVEIVQLAHNQ